MIWKNYRILRVSLHLNISCLWSWPRFIHISAYFLFCHVCAFYKYVQFKANVGNLFAFDCHFFRKLYHLHIYFRYLLCFLKHHIMLHVHVSSGGIYSSFIKGFLEKFNRSTFCDICMTCTLSSTCTKNRNIDPPHVIIEVRCAHA